MESKDQQLEAFKKAARELDADESDDALDRIMGKLDLRRTGCHHASDCALHNAPALPVGDCDCGVKGARRSSPCACRSDCTPGVAAQSGRQSST